MNSCTCHFIFLTGPRAGEVVEFSAGRITVGRAASADLRFDPETDLMVASLHAEILCDSGEFKLYDLGSRTGTFVNGQPAEEGQVLKSEDYIQFGTGGPEVIFRVGVQNDNAPSPPPPKLVAELEFRTGSEAGKIFKVTSDRPVRIGRRSDMEISLHPTEYLQVSGHHCSVVYEDGRFIVIDTSRNGTFVNERTVQGRAYLDDGSILQLAPGGPIAEFRIVGWHRDYPNLPKPEPGEDETVQEKKTVKTVEPLSGSRSSIDSNHSSQDVLFQISKEENCSRNSEKSLPRVESCRESSESNAGGKKRSWRRRRRALLVALASVVSAFILVATFLLVHLGSQRAVVSAPEQQDYLQQIQKGNELINAVGAYRIVVPRGWTKLESDSLVSIESPDKIIAVDYVRDPRLSESAVIDLLRAKGTIPNKLARSVVEGIPAVIYFGKGGSRVWIAFHLEPESNSPRLALTEVASDFFKHIPNAVFAELAVRQFQKLPGINAVPTAKGPTEQEVTTAPAIAQPAISQTPTRETPTGVPPQSSTARPDATRSSFPEAREPPETRTSCTKAGISFRLPMGWKAHCDEENAILFLYPKSGMEVRVTRDKATLDAAAVFAEMEKDGWHPLVKDSGGKLLIGTQRLAYSAFMQQDSRYAFLGLIDQPDSSTLVIYAQKTEEFSEEEKQLIEEVQRRLTDNQPSSP
jgi:pSer/pThr/pTyr-binding forkhead associated (FHA) protein